jgi:hypothetical protein
MKNQSKNEIVDNNNGTSTMTIKSNKYGVFKIMLDTNYVSLIQEYTWSIAKLRNKFYAVTGIPNSITGKSKTTYLHALLNGTPSGLVTDHINGDTLNNCLSNLRSVTLQQNLFNQPRAKGYVKLGEGRYRACIMLNKKFIHIGVFKTAKEAREAYLRTKFELHKIS